MDVAWSSCISLCVVINRQLEAARYNKKACASLQLVVNSINQYLEQIQRQGLTPAGQTAEGHLHEALKRAHKHVTRFVSMHPVVCLIMARHLQEKFMLLSRELMDSFTLIGVGEDLVHRSHATTPRPDLKSVQHITCEVLNSLLDEQEQRYSRMESAAQIAMRQGSSPESVQRVLLEELQGLEGLDDMTADELAASLEELQLAALCGLDEGLHKPLGSGTEEFLVQQLCQALQRQAVLQDTPQQAAAAAAAAVPRAPLTPPRGFVCPIRLEVMVKPVILVETGHTFERAAIECWLDGHDTCPLSNRKLMQPPQLVTNYSLQQSIEDWAHEHGVKLPQAPVYQRPFDLNAGRDQDRAAASSSSSRSDRVGRSTAVAPSSSSSSLARGVGGIAATSSAVPDLPGAASAQGRTTVAPTWAPRVLVLKGHTDGVECCAITPDGRTLVSGSLDCTLRLWDLVTGSCKHTLKGHTKRVWCCAITPDGRTLVSGSENTALRVWDLVTGSCKHKLVGHTTGAWLSLVQGVDCCAITPDGRTLVSGSLDCTLRLWDLVTGSWEYTLKGHSDPVSCCAITPDGRTLVSGSWGPTLRVWDLVTGSCQHKLKGHTDGVVCCAITPDGRTLVSGSEDKTLRVWDLVTGSCEHTLKGHTGDVRCCAITPDGRTLVSGSGDKTLRVWDLVTGSCKHTLEGHTQPVWCCAITPDGRTLVSGSLDCTLRLWDLVTGSCKHTLKGHTKRVWCCAITPDGRTLVSGSADKTLRLWDLVSGR